MSDACLNEPAVDAIAELHDASIADAPPGDSTSCRGLDNCGGARSEPGIGDDATCLFHSLLEIEGNVVDHCLHQIDRGFEQVLHSLLGSVPDDDIVDAGTACVACSSRNCIDAGNQGELEGDMLDDMRRIGAGAQPCDKSARMPLRAVMARQARQGNEQSVGKPGDLVAGEIGNGLQIQLHHQNRPARMDIRTGDRTDVEDLHPQNSTAFMPSVAGR